MRITIASVGKARGGPLQALYDEYAGRLPWPLSLREVEVKRQMPAAKRMEAEAELLLKAVPAGARLIVLDERGRSIDSVGFANRIGAYADDGVGDIAFLIGGADGHHETVRARADWLLSLGKMTWPHLMVRGLLAEQLYRASSILSGHPYHRA